MPIEIKTQLVATIYLDLVLLPSSERSTCRFGDNLILRREGFVTSDCHQSELGALTSTLFTLATTEKVVRRYSLCDTFPNRETPAGCR